MFSKKNKTQNVPQRNKGWNEEIEITCFQIISHAGTARSKFILAINAAEGGNFEKAEQLMTEGNEEYVISNRSHHEIIQMEENGVLRDPHLLLIHSEDQMMSAEAFKVMAEKFIVLYKEVKGVNEQG